MLVVFPVSKLLFSSFEALYFLLVLSPPMEYHLQLLGLSISYICCKYLGSVGNASVPSSGAIDGRADGPIVSDLLLTLRYCA